MVVQVLAQGYKLRIKQVGVDNANELYLRLAHQAEPTDWLDFTLCHIYPDDNQYLAKYGSLLKLFGGEFAKTATQRWFLLGFSGHYIDLKNKQSCVYTMLSHDLKFGDMQFSEPDAATWIQTHADLYQSWVTCPKPQQADANSGG